MKDFYFLMNERNGSTALPICESQYDMWEQNERTFTFVTRRISDSESHTLKLIWEEKIQKKKKQYQPGNKMPPEINDVFMWKQRRNEKQIMSKERKQNNKQQRKQRSNNKYILEKHNNNNYTNWLLKFGHEHINICCLCASIQIGYRTLRTVLRPLITCSTYKSSALLWQLKAWKKNKSNKIGATVDRWMSNEWMRWM